MKTMSTIRKLRYLILSVTLVYLSMNLTGQTSHSVSVLNNQFSPKILTVTAGDEVVWTNSSGSHNVNGGTATFPSNPASFGNSVGTDWTYKFVFNTPGTYNYQCDPHAGMGMVGQVVVNPKSTTGPFTLTVNFSAMTPHVGETLWLAVIDQATKTEIARVKKTVEVSFSVSVSGIEAGKSYNVDFFADHNKNGVYDTAPTDHTWRLQLNNVTSDAVLNFVHNTNFTDIAWKNKLTVHFTGMTPHVGEKLTLFLRQTDNGIYRDTIIIPQVATAAFDINSWEIKPGISYNIDFYADHNKNGQYDTPPTDHAWRLPLNNVKGDTIIDFVHNTTFTDIFSVTTNASIANSAKNLRLYPNPATDYIELFLPTDYATIRSVKIYSMTGTLINEKALLSNSESLRYNISQFKNGVYFMEINAGNQRNVLKFIKQ